MQLRTVCDKRLYVSVTSGSFEAKISIDIQQTSYFFMTFYDFLIHHFKKNVQLLRIFGLHIELDQSKRCHSVEQDFRTQKLKQCGIDDAKYIHQVTA